MIKLQISLENSPHPIKRKLLVPDSVNMMQLHYIIQISMGWEFAHLFMFADKKYNGRLMAALPEDLYETFEIALEADKASLQKDFMLPRENKAFYYCYDFGDDWWHKISFMKVMKRDEAKFKGIPLCIDAAGACPPEDIGGIWGYQHFLENINDPKSQEGKELRKWLGMNAKEKYNPLEVNIETINEELSAFFHSSEWNMKAKNYFS